MAYYDDQDEEQTTTPVGGQPTSPESSTISPAAGSGSAQAPASSSTTASPQTAKAPTFVGIQDYINANKPQTSKLVSNIGASAVSQGENALNAAGAAGNEYKTQVDQGASGTGAYHGPGAFENTDLYTNAQKGINAAQTTASQLGTDEGVKQILGDRQGATHNGVINQGALTLDSALVGADPNAQASLSGAKKNIDQLNLTGAFGNIVNSANASRQPALDALAQRQAEESRAAAAAASKAEADKKAAAMGLYVAPQTVPSSVKGLSATPVPKIAASAPKQLTADELMKQVRDAAAAKAKANQIALEQKQKAAAKAAADKAAADQFAKNKQKTVERIRTLSVGR